MSYRCYDDHPPDLADVILPRLEALMQSASTSYDEYLTAQSASRQQASHSGSSASIPGTAGSRRPEAPTTHMSELFKCPISHVSSCLPVPGCTIFALTGPSHYPAVQSIVVAWNV